MMFMDSGRQRSCTDIRDPYLNICKFIWEISIRSQTMAAFRALPYLHKTSSEQSPKYYCKGNPDFPGRRIVTKPFQ
ncbi:hypothetical protein Y032_0121g976 [Ancylostoma ceylanicum]|uniref:Uncharacterized protein n=1 Tax=Ancylostoma ceylanicum TaxID=53326 RepID=A0A016TAE2_9BILA|nr:hypothetical protein Y032_0121g976 [Ancylostoma ceylanicum]